MGSLRFVETDVSAVNFGASVVQPKSTNDRGLRLRVRVTRVTLWGPTAQWSWALPSGPQTLHPLSLQLVLSGAGPLRDHQSAVGRGAAGPAAALRPCLEAAAGRRL